MERGLEGCWACGELDGCRKGLLAKSKPRGFSLFVRRYGMQALLDRLRLTQVNVMPVPKAGGSTGAAAYRRFEHPAVAQFIQADAAIDVGDTLVGMHVRPVAVPLRMEGSEVGQAHVTRAYTRLPYIGGSRAQYPNG